MGGHLSHVVLDQDIRELMFQTRLGFLQQTSNRSFFVFHSSLTRYWTKFEKKFHIENIFILFLFNLRNLQTCFLLIKKSQKKASMIRNIFQMSVQDDTCVELRQNII